MTPSRDSDSADVSQSGDSAKPKRKREQRRDAAEEVCWKLLLLMGVGEFEQIPLRLRPIVADPMQKWADLAIPQPKGKP